MGMITRWFNSSKNKFPYCAEISVSWNDEKTIKQWCNQEPLKRKWGNLGYVLMNDERDVLWFILRWS
jgi:hypothetical protein